MKFRRKNEELTISVPGQLPNGMTLLSHFPRKRFSGLKIDIGNPFSTFNTIPKKIMLKGEIAFSII
jgi:hypothetical protein